MNSSRSLFGNLHARLCRRAFVVLVSLAAGHTVHATQATIDVTQALADAGYPQTKTLRYRIYWHDDPATTFKGAFVTYGGQAMSGPYQNAARAMDFVAIAMDTVGDQGPPVQTTGNDPFHFHRTWHNVLMSVVAQRMGSPHVAFVPQAYYGLSGAGPMAVATAHYDSERVLSYGSMQASEGGSLGFIPAKQVTGLHVGSEELFHVPESAVVDGTLLGYYGDGIHRLWRGGMRPVSVVGWGSGHDLDKGQKFEFALYLLQEIYRKRLALAGGTPPVDAGGHIVLPEIPLQEGWLGECITTPHRVNGSGFLPVGKYRTASMPILENSYTGYLPPRFPDFNGVAQPAEDPDHLDYGEPGYSFLNPRLNTPNGFEPVWLPTEAAALAYRAVNSSIRKPDTSVAQGQRAFPLVGDDFSNSPMAITSLAEFQLVQLGDTVTVTVDARTFGATTGGIKRMQLFVDAAPMQTLAAANAGGTSWSFSYQALTQGLNGIYVEAEDNAGNKTSVWRAIAVRKADPIVLNPDTFTVRAGEPVTLAPLANDTGGGLVITAVGSQALGALSIAPGGRSLAFLPGDATGQTSVSYEARDYLGNVRTSSFTLRVVPAELDLNLGLVAHYRFDEASGTALAESSGFAPALNGVLYNAPGWQPAGGKLGGSLAFGATANAHVRVADHDRLDGVSQFTLSIWVKPTAADATARGIVVKRESTTANSNYAYALIYLNGALLIDLNTQNNRLTTAALALNEWQHIAITFDGTRADPASRARYYHNGVLQNTFSEDGTALFNSASQLLIGGISTTAGSFTGSLDDLRMYNRALSAAEIAALATPGPELSLRRDDALVSSGATEELGPADVSSSRTLEYTLANLGSLPATLAPATISLATNVDASILLQPALTIAVNAQTSLRVNLAPRAAGPWSATFSFANNDADENPFTWTVAGLATTPVDDWKLVYDDQLGITAGGDLDGDGVRNLLEFVHGRDPQAQDITGDEWRVVDGAPSGHLRIKYRQIPNLRNVLVRIETSADLVNWTTRTDLAPEVVVAESNATVNIMRVDIPIPANTPRLFARLMAEEAP